MPLVWLVLPLAFPLLRLARLLVLFSSMVVVQSLFRTLPLLTILVIIFVTSNTGINDSVFRQVF